MSRNLLSAIALGTTVSLANAGPRGTVPKASADLYPAHADEHDGTRIGASLMNADEVRRAFGFDVDRTCLIIEVALYPKDGQERKLLVSDFSLRIAGTNTVVKPSTATAVAANWQQVFRERQGVKTDPFGEVAVGSHEVHAEGQVHVGTVDSSPHPASEKDRATLEAELAEKALAEGKASSPVAGYLYFPMLPRKKHTALQLDHDTNGSSVTLQFPQK